jgi:hypothetical protein
LHGLLREPLLRCKLLLAWLASLLGEWLLHWLSALRRLHSRAGPHLLRGLLLRELLLHGLHRLMAELLLLLHWLSLGSPWRHTLLRRHTLLSTHLLGAAHLLGLLLHGHTLLGHSLLLPWLRSETLLLLLLWELLLLLSRELLSSGCSAGWHSLLHFSLAELLVLHTHSLSLTHAGTHTLHALPSRHRFLSGPAFWS